MPGSGGSEATTGPLTGQISTAGQIHTEQETRQEALSNVKCSVPNLLPILASLKRKIVLSRLQAVCMRCMQTDYPSYAIQEY